jgi:hypothetical protein
MRLVDSLREYRARPGILRFGISRSEQKRSPGGNTAAGPKDREEGMLRSDRKLRHPAALRSARCDSDHRHPDENFRARDDQIK